MSAQINSVEILVEKAGNIFSTVEQKGNEKKTETKGKK